ncbi:cysteine desulfurase [Candidatus Saccharibacteria bacterium]|nr:cysteine desulfurase [Candidatus Saccharibacteria bacterium]
MLGNQSSIANYFDYAAATPVDARVLAAMQPYYSEQFYNPSATYAAARSVQARLDAARTDIAHWLGARPSEIIFTAGGTEANNIAIHGVMRRFPEANVVASGIEHSAVLAPAKTYLSKLAPVNQQGIVDVAALTDLIDEQTVLVSIMYANNEIGTVQPIREIGRLIAGIRKNRLRAGNKLPIYFHTDACQAANYLDLHAARLGVDLMTLNGGKIYGPKQSGIVFVRGGTILTPLIEGGGQERNLRSGTENIAQAIGFAKALDIAQTMRSDETKRLQALQHYFFAAIEAQLPTAVVNGNRRLRLPNNVHITIAGCDNERLLIQLDAVGIMAAAGSACSASDEAASHVLAALGLSEADSRASLRFSMGRATDQAAIDHLVTQLAAIVAD